jgi:thiamine pyrophosphate-dependent acetolactate synthase large subunit-like protein
MPARETRRAVPIEQHSFKIQDAAADAKLLLDNELATMGAGLPSATIAACLQPDRRVLAVCGDGGAMMNSQGSRPPTGLVSTSWC